MTRLLLKVTWLLIKVTRLLTKVTWLLIKVTRLLIKVTHPKFTNINRNIVYRRACIYDLAPLDECYRDSGYLEIGVQAQWFFIDEFLE